MTMENGSQPLIRLDAVSKVFVTDEVETHALQRSLRREERGVPIDFRSFGLRKVDPSCHPRAAGYADGRDLLSEREAGNRLEAERAGAHPQPRNRLHLPGLQPDRRSYGVRKRGTAADVPRHAGDGAQTARPGSPGAGGDEPPDEALPVTTFGRPAAARGSGSRLERRSVNPAGRRAHGEPGFG